jgi:hypothetical protein
MSIDKQMREIISIGVGSDSFHLLPGKRIIQIPRITNSTAERYPPRSVLLAFSNTILLSLTTPSAFGPNRILVK